MASEFHLIVSSTKHTLQEIATHAYSLAMSLQNVAPPINGSLQKTDSIQYLLETSKQINSINTLIDSLSKGSGGNEKNA